MAGRFQGQHAVMTGGASGIGAAVLAKLQGAPYFLQVHAVDHQGPGSKYSN